MMKLPYVEAQRVLDKMTLRQKLGQLVLASIEVTHLDAGTREFLRKNCVGNVILFGKNCSDRAQIAALCAELHSEIEGNCLVQPLLAIDQEGGSVTRIRNGATVFPCAMAVGATGDPENAYMAGRIMGHELRALGIYLNCAPVLDVNVHKADPRMSRRSYGTTAEECALFGGAAARGMRDAGIIDCGKHFPGHGYTHVDTHFAFALDNAPRDRIYSEMLPPFRTAIDDGMRSVMATHVCYSELEDGGFPATMSHAILRTILRDELGFEGLAISDGMQMHAISKTYTSPVGCVKAIEAGCDLVITGDGGDYAAPDAPDVQTPCIEALERAVQSGELSAERVEESALRVVAVKLALGDMRPQSGVENMDWSANQAFSTALSRSVIRVYGQSEGCLPIGEGAFFISEKCLARKGVLEGDRLWEGFASLASHVLHGSYAEYEGEMDIEALLRVAACAKHVVVGVAEAASCEAARPLLEALQGRGHKVVVVCMNGPHLLPLLPQDICTLVSYDQTASAIRAACAVLSGAR